MMFVRTGRICCVINMGQHRISSIETSFLHEFQYEFQKRERRRRKQVAFIDAFQRVTGWWEVMCQILSEYISELHTE